MRVLLVTPPMSNLNAPYPATPYLYGHLRNRGHQVTQADASLEVFLRLFSQTGFARMKAALEANKNVHGQPAVAWFLENYATHASVIDPTIRYLQGKNDTLSLRICNGLLPAGPFAGTITDEENLDIAFGMLGTHDRAQYVASVYAENLTRVINQGIDPFWNRTEWGTGLIDVQSDRLFDRVKNHRSLITTLTDEVTTELVAEHSPEVVGLTMPFGGNFLGAATMARKFRELAPDTKIIVGGGLINTAMRSLTDTRIFDICDYITVDDGERPFDCLLEFFEGKRGEDKLLRTFVKRGDQVELISTPDECDVSTSELSTPSYETLPMDRYVHMVELPNPLQRLWADGRWNHLTLAHGCYWRKCTFCDVALPYVGDYKPTPVDILVNRMVEMIAETGESGFHFVDEAAPPALLRQLSQKLIEKKVSAGWWTNIRFEKAFTPELTQLMFEAGCIAVTGGLEVASDRLLKLINKGVTIEQVARVTNAFGQAGILVHAYLMFGFPTQTDQEIVDSLEVVRQLFAHNCIDSGFWHRFGATVHSPVGMEPDLFKVRLHDKPTVQHHALERYNAKIRLKTDVGNSLIQLQPPASQAPLAKKPVLFEYTVPFDALEGDDPSRFQEGLAKAVHWYMHGVGFDDEVSEWFDFDSPAPKISPDLISKYLGAENG